MAEDSVSTKEEKENPEELELKELPSELAEVHRALRKVAKSDNPRVRRKLAQMLEEFRESRKAE